MLSLLSRRSTLGWLATGVCSLASSQARPTWPSGPVTIVVPAPSGGVLDAFIRLLSDSLAADLGQRFLVETVDTADGQPPREVLQLAMGPAGLRMRLRRRA